jgi:hypothetical protein
MKSTHIIQDMNRWSWNSETTHDPHDLHMPHTHTQSEVPSPLPIGKMYKQDLLSVSSYQDNNAQWLEKPEFWAVFLGRLMRYLVVCNFGCLIQSLDCLQLSTGIQCLECASMIHLLFISRKIEADSGTHGSGPQKWDAEPILASLSASFNFAVT